MPNEEIINLDSTESSDSENNSFTTSISSISASNIYKLLEKSPSKLLECSVKALETQQPCMTGRERVLNWNFPENFLSNKYPIDDDPININSLDERLQIPTTSGVAENESVSSKNTNGRKNRSTLNKERVKTSELNGKSGSDLPPDVRKYPEYQFNLLKKYNKENSNSSTIKLRCSYTKMENDLFKVPETPPIPRSSLNQDDINPSAAAPSADDNCNQQSFKNTEGELEKPTESHETSPSPNSYKEEFYKYLGIDTNPCHDKQRKDDGNHSKGKRRSLRVKVQQIAQNNLAKFHKEQGNDKTKIAEKEMSTSSCENTKSCPSSKNLSATELNVERNKSETVNNDKQNRLNNNVKMKIARGRKPKNDKRTVKIEETTEVKIELNLSDVELNLADTAVAVKDEATVEKSIEENANNNESMETAVKSSPRSSPVCLASANVQSPNLLVLEEPLKNIKVEVKPERSLLIVKRSYVCDDKPSIVIEKSPTHQYKAIILNKPSPNASKLENQNKQQSRSHIFHRVDYRKTGEPVAVVDQNAKKLKLSPTECLSDNPDSNKSKIEINNITSKVPENKCNESMVLVHKIPTLSDQKTEQKSNLREDSSKQKQNPDSTKKSDKILANQSANKQGRRNSKRICKNANADKPISVQQEADSESTPKRVKQLQLRQLRQKYIRLSRVLQTKHSICSNNKIANKLKSTTLQTKIPGDEYSPVSNQIECATVPLTTTHLSQDEDEESTNSDESFPLKGPEQPDSTIHVVENQPLNKIHVKSTLAILHINNTIITVEENAISFWICPSLIYTTFNGNSEWKLAGKIDRRSIDMEIPCFHQNRVCKNDKNPIYYELRAKEYEPNEVRECYITSLYICIYFIDKNNEISVQYVDLDKISCMARSVRYILLPDPGAIAMSWMEKSQNGERNGLCVYYLQTDLEALNSVREFSWFKHNINGLQYLEDDKLLGFGYSIVTMWNHRTGDLLMNIDMEMNIGSNLDCLLWREDDEECLVLAQNFEETDSQLIKIIAIKLISSYSYRIITSHSVPLDFKRITSYSLCSDRLIVTFECNASLLMSLITPDFINFKCAASDNDDVQKDYNLFVQNDKMYTMVDNNQIIVKPFYEHLWHRTVCG